MWTPRTPEDRLIALYLKDNPGMLFLEVEVGQGDENCGRVGLMASWFQAVRAASAPRARSAVPTLPPPCRASMSMCLRRSES